MAAIYKKRINKKGEASDIEYVVSNNLGVYINMPVGYKDFAPYHGLFIKQKDFNSEIYLDRIIEEIEIGKKIIGLEQELQFENGVTDFNNTEYLDEFNIYPIPTEKYLESGVTVIKKYILSQDSNVLCIRYDITNNSNENIKFKTYPYVTKREPFEAKRQSELKLTKSKIEFGTKITLSIKDNINLYLRSKEFKCVQRENYVCGIKYNYQEGKDSLKTYINDAYIPAIFEADIKKGKKQILEIFVSISNEDILNYSSDKMLKDVIRKNEDITAKIDEKYYELKSMAISVNSLNYIDRENKRFVVLDSIPFQRDKREYITNLVASIEGNYITLGKYKQAYMIISNIPSKIDYELKMGNITRQEEIEASLTLVDIINKYIVESECCNDEKKTLFSCIERVINNCINLRKEDDYNFYVGEDGLISIDDHQYLKINCLWYNALKVYINLFDSIDNKSKENFGRIYTISEKVKDNMVKEFWSEENRVLKYESTGIGEASSDMLYALSLSNPVICDNIAIKIIDSVFKELYTPYGIRKFGIRSKEYDGYVYPYLMASFVKANLRQNGVTRATQKIAYNLVKELLLEINKSNIGSIKYMYDDKTRRGYGPTISGITNAEMIRLFNMLT